MSSFLVALWGIVALIISLCAVMWAYYQRGRDSIKREVAEDVAAIEKKRTIEANKPIASRSDILKRMREGKL